MNARTVEALETLTQQRMTATFSAYGLRRGGAVRLDPFINLDDFMMSEPTFPPHPHAGFSAVTYMFEDSPGAFLNRDSLGDRSRIEPGSIHWTQAAHGMMHEEVPEHPGTPCHGVQVFVNLAHAHKSAKPRAFHVSRSDVPEWRPHEGARVRVLAGQMGGVASPMTELLTPVTFADVVLNPGVSLSLPAPHAHTAFVMGIRGSVLVAADAREVNAHQAVGFANDGDVITLRGGPNGAQLLFGAGAPLNEPLVFGGPFGMSSTEAVRDAQLRFRRGEMGNL